MSDHAAPSKGIQLGNGLYDFLNNFVKIGLPAVGTFYATAGAFWGWPNINEVVGTILAFATLLGVFLVLAKRSYDRNSEEPALPTTEVNGVFEVNFDDPMKDTYALVPNIPFEELANKDTITFAVKKTGETL